MDIINIVSTSTGLKPAQIINYSLYLGVALVMLGFGSTYITTILGVAYPAFMSFNALETEGTDDDTQWLTYWVCFGCFNIIDQFAGIILQFNPFYYFLKLGALVYLFHPKSMGASNVYHTFIEPYFDEYEKAINDTMAQAKSKGDELKKKASSIVNKSE